MAPGYGNDCAARCDATYKVVLVVLVDMREMKDVADHRGCMKRRSATCCEKQ